MALGVLCLYGLHRYYLVFLYYRYKNNVPRVESNLPELPRVTVQLPMYNERYVAARSIEAACRIEYPRELLEIQVLDDSTDETTTIARACAARLREQGFDVKYIHRDNRAGFKAGALAEGTAVATGEFVAVFDADFVAPPNILRDAIHHFSDPKVGMVQTRWEHLNRSDSLLTNTQAVLLDGHFVLEHGARCRSGRFMSFNGTAGIWRKQCIIDAGGWHYDTLTEDLDLSYRAQLAGWKFLYINDLGCPAELPPEINSFKSQQHRWSKGGAQTCRKLLPTLLKADLPFSTKLEAFVHLTSCTVSVFMLILVLLLFPALCVKFNRGPGSISSFGWLVDAGLFMIATCSAGTFFARSQRELGRSWSESLKYLPFLMSLGVGSSINNAKAVAEGFFGRGGEFVRTPKFGVSAEGGSDWTSRRAYRPKQAVRIQPVLELGMGAYLVVCLILSLVAGEVTIGIPFMALFAIGFIYVGANSLFPPGSRLGGHSVAANEPIAADIR